MRVHMVVLNDYPPDIRVHKEAKTLAAAGNEVTIFALWRDGLAVQEYISGYQVKRLKLHSRIWRGYLVAPIVKYCEFNLKLWQVSRIYPAQIYHAHDAKALLPAWIASRQNRAMLVYDAHELETGRNFGSTHLAGIYKKAWSLPEDLLIRKAAAVITVSEGIANELARLYAIPKPLVIVNCPEKQTQVTSSRLRDELNIPPHLKIALYQGNLVSGRGIETFIESVQLLPTVAGVILGDGPLRVDLQHKLKSGVLERVYLPGRVPQGDLSSYTSSADIGMVLTQDTCMNHHYSLPNKLFEYIQGQLPIIGSNLPEISSIIREYDVGEIADPDNSESIVAAMHRLLENPDRYAQAKSNTQRAATVFNWEKEGSKLLALYRQLHK